MKAPEEGAFFLITALQPLDIFDQHPETREYTEAMLIELARCCAHGGGVMLGAFLDKMFDRITEHGFTRVAMSEEGATFDVKLFEKR